MSGGVKVPDLNKVLIAGRITHDPELKYTQSGRAVCSFGIANDQYYRKDGESKKSTTFASITCWDKLAEFVGEHLSKGRPVLIEGRLKSDAWEDQSGQKRTKLEIVASRVQPLDWDEDSKPQQPKPAPARREIEEPIPDDDVPF